MIRNICKDELFLARKSELATPEDLPVAHDLLETLIAHQDGCVGMAANMIGVNKRIIAVENQDTYLVLFNPVILKRPILMMPRGLPFPHRHPARKALADHQSAVAERKIPDPRQNVHRLDRPDHPARDRPLRRHHYLITPGQRAKAPRDPAGLLLSVLLF